MSPKGELAFSSDAASDSISRMFHIIKTGALHLHERYKVRLQPGAVSGSKGRLVQNVRTEQSWSLYRRAHLTSLRPPSTHEMPQHGSHLFCLSSRCRVQQELLDLKETW